MRVQTRRTGSPLGDTGRPGLGTSGGAPSWSPHPGPWDACPPARLQPPRRSASTVLRQPGPARATLTAHRPGRGSGAPRRPSAGRLLAGLQAEAGTARTDRRTARRPTAPPAGRAAPRAGVPELRPEGGEAAPLPLGRGRCRSACGEDSGSSEPNGAPKDRPVCRPRPPGGESYGHRRLSAWGPRVIACAHSGDLGLCGRDAPGPRPGPGWGLRVGASGPCARPGAALVPGPGLARMLWSPPRLGDCCPRVHSNCSRSRPVSQFPFSPSPRFSSGANHIRPGSQRETSLRLCLQQSAGAGGGLG